MDGDERPKLNLRSRNASSSEPSPAQFDDTDVGAVLARAAEVQRRTVSSQSHSYQQQTGQRPSSSTNRHGSTDGMMFRSQGVQKRADIDDLWGTQDGRLFDEEPFEVGKVIDKVGSALGGASKRFKDAYSQASEEPPRSVGDRLKRSAAAQPTQPNEQRVSQARQQPQLRPQPRPVTSKTSKKATAKPNTVAQDAPRTSSPFVRFLKSLRVPYFLKNMRARTVVGAFTVLIVVFGASRLFGGSTPSPNGPSSVQGAKTTASSPSGDASSSETIAVVGRDTEFDLLFPPDVEKEELGIAVVSPPDAPPVYGYNYEMSGALLNVSHQEVPDTFGSDIDTSLKDLADSFSATDIITASDGTIIFHGYSEKNGGVQSLIFIKENLLILVSSTERLSDSAWSSFVSELQ